MMSKLAVFLLVLFVAEFFVDGVLIKKLKHRRLSASDLLKRREGLPTNSKFFQIGLPFDYIFDVVSVGTPANDFEVTIETGYNKLFILDSSYPALTPWNEVYDPSNSSTSKTYENYDYGYSGVNTLEGWRYGDNINFFVGDFKQTFNTITDISTLNNTKPYLEFSGILGFGWDPEELKNDVNEASSPFINIANSLNILKIITFWQEQGDGFSETIMSYGAAGIGGVCADDIQYFPITSYAPYSGLNFKVDGFKFGSYSKTGDFTGQLDTGVSIIYVPSTISDRISRIISPTFNNDLYLYTTDCSKADTLNDWIFTISGRQFNLPASQYIIDIGLPDNQCIVAFGTFDGFTPDFVFGMPMLRQYCSIYDAESNQVGLATAIHDTYETTTVS